MSNLFQPGKPHSGPKRNFRNDEIHIRDFTLLEMLECKGSCDYWHSFQKSRDEKTLNGLLLAMKKLMYDERIALTTCSLIMAKFLLELAKIASKKFYGMCAMILRALFDCLNLYGYVVLNKLEQQNKKIRISFRQDTSSPSFCDYEGADFVSIIFDFFVKNFLRNYLNTIDFEFDFVVKFLSFFNNWLIQYGFSKVTTRFISL
jgi:hypothetical protein